MGAFRNLLDIIFPPRCVFCRKILPTSRRSVCDKCLDELPYTGSNCSRKGDFFSVCVSPLYYEDEVRDSILRFKFKEATGYASTYGLLIADCIRRELEGRYDLISWVPLSKGRFKERGYDQAMLIAMAAALELDDVAVSTLEKTAEVARQSRMGSPEKRRANIMGAYSVPDRELVEGKRILLIDDIITSGSTLSECARTLKSAGAQEVLCATIARARD